MAEFRSSVDLTGTPDQALAWHARTGAFERLSPPWERVEILRRDPGIAPGARVTLRLPFGPIPLVWELEHAAAEGGTGFADVQVRGPFASWRHDHLFHAAPGGCRLEDRVQFTMPLFPGFGWGADFVRPRLEQLFEFRHRVTHDDLAHVGRYAAKPRARVLISGSSGLLGNALACFLSTGGHGVVRLTREGTAAARAMQPEFPTLSWNPSTGFSEDLAAQQIDAVVHLAGENLSGGPWTPARKARILESRVAGTRTLAESLAKSRRPPATFICASAIGWYGSRGEELLDENSRPGAGFLAEVCRAWEAATEPARAAGIRVVHLRFGVILSGRGGALPKMATPFRFGLGGKLGSGNQFFSWISLDDALEAISTILFEGSFQGPFNLVAPRAVRNSELTRTLGRVLQRPTPFDAPAGLLSALLGEMAREMLLSSTRVVPGRLEEIGFKFRHPELEGALRHEFGLFERGSRATLASAGPGAWGGAGSQGGGGPEALRGAGVAGRSSGAGNAGGPAAGEKPRP